MKQQVRRCTNERNNIEAYISENTFEADQALALFPTNLGINPYDGVPDQNFKSLLAKQRRPSHWEDLPLADKTALTLTMKPGSAICEDYATSWKSSRLPCFVESLYEYKDAGIPKTWFNQAHP